MILYCQIRFIETEALSRCAQEHQKGNAMKILVMDDSEVNRKAATILLAGHEVTTVENFDQAIDVLRQEKFDAVLTDLLTPPFVHGFAWSKFSGQEIPFGAFLALKALQLGVKFVAIVTSTNHHDNPAAAAIDYLMTQDMRIGNSRFECWNSAVFYLKEDTLEPVGGCDDIGGYPSISDERGEKTIGYKGLVCTKPWHQVLEWLLST